MISETGVWSEEEQHAHIFSYNIAKWVKDFLRQRGLSYIYDFGCGSGKYTEYFNEVGLFCQGFDGHLPNNKVEKVYQHDLTTPLELRVACNILCLEVWEHIPAEYEDAFLDNIIDNLGIRAYLILSVAVEGQEGLGHVNCRSNEYVINKLQERGVTYLPELTEQIRKEPEPYVSYFKNNLMIFKK